MSESDSPSLSVPRISITSWADLVKSREHEMGIFSSTRNFMKLLSHRAKFQN
jgi:hypothetical protein